MIDSVCEECNPAVKSDGWSLKPGYFHDRDFATSHLDGVGGSPQTNRGGLIQGPNNYGMIFQKNTNGCQLLPEITMPTSPSSNLGAALANPSTSGDIAAVGARLTSAFAMIESATKDNQGAEIVAAWYHGDPATCTRAADFCLTESAGACVHSDVCAHTPAAHADVMAAKFETNMHYGHSVARIKVMQALAIFANELATSTTTANMADIKKDILAHMLVPMYQGAVLSAHKMDDPNTAAAGLADFAAYWNIIKDKVTFEANDKARLEALSMTLGTNNLCTVKTLLHRNLPDGSKLLYTHDWIPCPDGRRHMPCPGAMGTTHANQVTGAHHLKAAEAFQNDNGVVEAVHLSAADIGILSGSRSETDGSEMVCPFLSPWVAGATRSSSDLKTGIADLAAATNSFEVGAGSSWGWGAMIVEEATVPLGTKLVFKWSSGHNVVMTTADAWASCIPGDEGSECLATDTYFGTGDCENGPIATVAGGKNTFEAVVSNIGEYYFICAVPGHCSSQKVKVTVTPPSQPPPVPPPDGSGGGACDACCPVGTCDSPADANKPECTACNACQTVGTPCSAGGGSSGGGGGGSGAGDVVAVDITSDKSTTGETMMKTAIGALCACALLAIVTAAAPRSLSLTLVPPSDVRSRRRGWRLPSDHSKPQQRRCDRLPGFRLPGGSDPTDGQDREGAD